jgi:hypothetical protein
MRLRSGGPGIHAVEHPSQRLLKLRRSLDEDPPTVQSGAATEPRPGAGASGRWPHSRRTSAADSRSRASQLGMGSGYSRRHGAGPWS